MNTPTISLIISALNEEKNIGECLSSAIKNAGSKLLEIIVVDSGSTDDTKKIAEGFSGVKVFNENQKGVMFARQRGVVESSGEILAFVDADNRIGEEWIDTAIEEFNKNPSLVCLSGPYIYYDLSPFKNKLAAFYWKVVVRAIAKIFGYAGNFGNMFIRKDVILQMGGLDTSIVFYGDDTNTAKRASKFGKVIFNPNMPVLSSGRRFEKDGFIRTTLVYAYNFFAQAFFNSSSKTSYKSAR